MVHLDQPGREYTIQVAGDGLNQKVFSTATLSYKGGRKHNFPNPSINYAGQNTSASVRFLDEKTAVPFPPIHPSKTADQTVKLELRRKGLAWEWSLNENQTFNVELEDIPKPLLWDPTQPFAAGLTITTKNNTWVDLVLIASIADGLQPSHPIHKHSNKGHIIVSTRCTFSLSFTLGIDLSMLIICLLAGLRIRRIQLHRHC